MIAATFPADLAHAAFRALLVIGGGAMQIVIVALLWQLAPIPFIGVVPPMETPPPGTLGEAWRTLERAAAVSSARFRYCVGLGLSVAGAVLLFRGLALPNGYWVPMTVLIVLRFGGFRETLGRGLARCAGTLLGAGLATMFAALARPSPAGVIALAALAIWACYALQWVNYGAFSAALTAYVVFIFALIGLPEPVVAVHRVIATLIGGGVALAGQVLVRNLGGGSG